MLKRKRSESLQKSRRAHLRYECRETCTIKTSQRDFRGRTTNISEGGSSIELRSMGNIPVGETVFIRIGQIPQIQGIVRWANDRMIGVQFISAPDDFLGVQNLINDLVRNSGR